MDVASGSTGVDVLVVGAGPTGLALALQLSRFGASVLVIDAKAHPVEESRALALQPRTLEVLRGSVTAQLLERGNRGVRLVWHAGSRTVELPMFDMGLADTAYPFLLFLAQAETERILVGHLAQQGVDVAWNTRLAGLAPAAITDQPEPELVTCDLVGPSGQQGLVSVRYVVGCDGAHSTVRRLAGIGFPGGRYPQTFLLADVDAEGLEPGAAHVWAGPAGPLLFFPLVRPAAWRLLTPRPGQSAAARATQRAPSEEDSALPVAGQVELAELQAMVDAATGGRVRLGSPVWSTAFQLHHRHAEAYRRGRVFLAGDAAHVHSPAGAQGMNTGIQEAMNLGWKLALVCRGHAPEGLLDTYELERRPVGAFVVRYSDRAFRVATSMSTPARFARSQVVPRAIGLGARFPSARAVAFRTASQLDVRYPDTMRVIDPARIEQFGPARRLVGRLTRRKRRLAAGDRLPDVRIHVDGRSSWMQDLLTDPAFHLLLCGPGTAFDEQAVDRLERRHAGLLRVHRVQRQDGARPATPAPGVTATSRGSRVPVIRDRDGAAFARWGIASVAQLLVRPDGHLALRRDDGDLTQVTAFLSRWLSP